MLIDDISCNFFMSDNDGNYNLTFFDNPVIYLYYAYQINNKYVLIFSYSSQFTRRMLEMHRKKYANYNMIKMWKVTKNASIYKSIVDKLKEKKYCDTIIKQNNTQINIELHMEYLLSLQIIEETIQQHYTKEKIDTFNNKKTIDGLCNTITFLESTIKSYEKSLNNQKQSYELMLNNLKDHIKEMHTMNIELIKENDKMSKKISDTQNNTVDYKFTNNYKSKKRRNVLKL